MMNNEAIRQASLNLISSYSESITEQYPELMMAFRTRAFIATETGIHPKLLADWNRKGLLIATHKKNKMHRFTLGEFVWIKLIERMRSFNFSYEFIIGFRQELVAKQSVDLESMLNDPQIAETLAKMLGITDNAMIKVVLTNPDIVRKIIESVSENLETMNSLDTLIMVCVVMKCPLSFLVDETGKGTLFCPLIFQDLKVDKADLNRMLCQSFVSLSLSQVVAEVLAMAPINKIAGELNLVTPQEATVLEALREKDLLSVAVRFDKQHQMELMEVSTSEKVDKRARLLELILMNGYQDITVKTQKGDIVYCENTRKVKLK
jgi:DNA-binding transcriptional MerR regulator